MEKPWIIELDFETYSEADIEDVGAWNYSKHPSTDLQCLAYKRKGLDREPRLWKAGEPFPLLLQKAIDMGAIFVAHSAGFEICIWANVAVPKYGWPEIAFKFWRCTAAKAAFFGLPRKMDKICTLLELGDRGKDMAGHAIMLKLARPRKPTKANPDTRWTPQTKPEDFARLYEYNLQDVRVEEYISEYCPEGMPAKEVLIWQLDQKINQRGIPIDRKLCEGAVQILTEVQRRACKAMVEATSEQIQKPTQVEAIKEWLKQRNVPLGIGKKGVPCLDEQALKEMLERPGLPSDVEAVLKARESISLSSVKKYAKALMQADENDRCRDQHAYGAAGTLRWGGLGVQFQNLKRPPEDFITAERLAAIYSGDCDALAALDEPLPGKSRDPLRVLANCVRGAVKAPDGREIVAPDFSSIEARLTYWFAGDLPTLEKFANNVDLYIDFAAEHVYKVPVADIATWSDKKNKWVINPEHNEKRQVGKQAVLGLGFGMGWEKFKNSVYNATGIVLTEEFARGVVAAYRAAFPEVVQIWRDLQVACLTCVRTGETISGNRWEFSMETNHRGGEWLVQRLPSGRKMYYFKPREAVGPYGKEVKYTSNKGVKSLSPSVLIENLVQATARDLMAEAMLRLDSNNVRMFGHVHDSIWSEVRTGDTETPKRIEGIMSQVPQWAKGLPVAVETKIGQRLA